MKYQVVMTLEPIPVVAHNREEAARKVKEAIDRDLPGWTYPIEVGHIEDLGRGLACWNVYLQVKKIGRPIEANSPEEAIEKICQVMGLQEDGLTAFEVR